jgi:MerR family transcriptional regulator, copper efflux regulator
MRIGDLAHRTGLSTKTIRYYETIGVLPEPRRSPSGYRDYDPETCERLQFVRSAQAVGLRLGEIREILAYRDRGETPCAHVVEVIRRRASQIDEQIAQLEGMRSELRRLERRARTLDPEDCAPRNVCHVIPPAVPARP